VSALLKTVEAFDLVQALRTEQRGALEELGKSLTLEGIDAALTAAPERPSMPSAPRETEVTMPMTAPVAAEAGASTLPSNVWMPTHEMKRRAQAWEQADPTARVTGTLDSGLPVQVLERNGDWAHIMCANGWSAWVDGRDLKER
jgi:hypothetical protein